MKDSKQKKGEFAGDISTYCKLSPCPLLRWIHPNHINFPIRCVWNRQLSKWTCNKNFVQPHSNRKSAQKPYWKTWQHPPCSKRLQKAQLSRQKFSVSPRLIYDVQAACLWTIHKGAIVSQSTSVRKRSATLLSTLHIPCLNELTLWFFIFRVP